MDKLLDMDCDDPMAVKALLARAGLHMKLSEHSDVKAIYRRLLEEGVLPEEVGVPIDSPTLDDEDKLVADLVRRYAEEGVEVVAKSGYGDGCYGRVYLPVDIDPAEGAGEAIRRYEEASLLEYDGYLPRPPIALRIRRDNIETIFIVPITRGGHADPYKGCHYEALWVRVIDGVPPPSWAYEHTLWGLVEALKYLLDNPTF